MKYLQSILLVIVTGLFCQEGFGQQSKLYGLWEINKVTVGEEIMTPVAKWTRINEDGSFQSGNGWLQNSNGTWQFDEVTAAFSAIDPLAPEEEFGAFSVSFQGTNMKWQREEEGMQVNVYLKPIEELPMAPADYLQGMWDLVEIKENGHSILSNFDPDDKYKIFFRWDREYRLFTSDGNRQSGYWHINGHRPDVTLLPRQDDKQPESWRIQVDEKTLIMTGISKENEGVVKVFKRR